MGLALCNDLDSLVRTVSRTRMEARAFSFTSDETAEVQLAAESPTTSPSSPTISHDLLRSPHEFAGAARCRVRPWLGPLCRRRRGRAGCARGGVCRAGACLSSAQPSSCCGRSASTAAVDAPEIHLSIDAGPPSHRIPIDAPESTSPKVPQARRRCAASDAREACSLPSPRAPAAAALALRSGEFVLSPCTSCGGGRIANFQRPCARWAKGMRACLVMNLAYFSRNAWYSAATFVAWPLRGTRWPDDAAICSLRPRCFEINRDLRARVRGMSVERRHRSESLPNALHITKWDKRQP